jgi:hypothetical protein
MANKTKVKKKPKVKKKLKAQTTTKPDRLKDTMNAYLWENTQITVWQNNMTNNPAPPANNVIAELFKNIWDSYFAQVMKSNQAIIDICTDSTLTPDEAISLIDDTEHLRGSLGKVGDAARGANDGKSVYFGQLEQLMQLELEARDNLQRYLETGKPPSPPPYP